MRTNGKKKVSKQPLCIRCLALKSEKPRHAASRGVCRPHLREVWDEINDGKLTERDAEDTGRLLPAKPSGRPRLKQRRKPRKPSNLAPSLNA